MLINTPISLGSDFNFSNAIGIEKVAKRGRELSTRFRNGIAITPEIKISTPENAVYSSFIITKSIRCKDNLKLNPIRNKQKNLRMRGIYETTLMSYVFHLPSLIVLKKWIFD
ncbi:MAG: selenocysteine lyase/cysteine desulfurase [Sediminicola sp.]